jgi:hypothetical protein
MKEPALEAGRGAAAATPFRGSDPFATPPGGAADPFASPPVAAAGPPQRQAAFDYAATEAGELSFSKGDMIVVISEDASGWWQGKNMRSGETGSFPSNYTTPSPVAAPAGSALSGAAGGALVVSNATAGSGAPPGGAAGGQDPFFFSPFP